MEHANSFSTSVTVPKIIMELCDDGAPELIGKTLAPVRNLRKNLREILSLQFKKEDRIEVNYQGKGKWYLATYVREHDDRTKYDVIYDDTPLGGPGGRAYAVRKVNVRRLDSDKFSDRLGKVLRKLAMAFRSVELDYVRVHTNRLQIGCPKCSKQGVSGRRTFSSCSECDCTGLNADVRKHLSKIERDILMQVADLPDSYEGRNHYFHKKPLNRPGRSYSDSW